jgi:hypothetical protein
MNKILAYIFAILLAFLPATVVEAKSSVKGSDAAAEAALAKILPNYTDWSNVEFSGKLVYKKLPINPTVKIYMERNTLMQISIRAPFVGEVGRIELTPDSLLAINKMGKTYCRESLSAVESVLPNAISYLQNLFLARVSVMGSGELSESNAAGMCFIDDEQGGWLIVPTSCEEDTILSLPTYGYAVSSNGRTSAMMLNLEIKNIMATVQYTYANSSMDIDLSVSLPSKEIDASLDFDSVKWGGSRMSEISLTNKYKKLGIKEFVKSF